MVELSNAEQAVAKLLATTNKHNKHIADELFVSEKTIKFHITNIYKKLGLKNRADLIMNYSATDYVDTARSINRTKENEMDTLPNNQGYQAPTIKKVEQQVRQIDQRDKINFIDEKFKVGKSIDQLHNMMMEVTKDDMTANNVNAACNCVSRINETINTAIQAARFLSGR